MAGSVGGIGDREFEAAAETGEAGSDLWGKIGICGRKISEARLCFGLKLGEETYLEISEVQWGTIIL